MKRYYPFNKVVSFEEDMTHEFKGHRNLQTEDIPDSAYEDRVNRQKRTRKPVSETINGFLNTGKGGIVYLGIVDSGAAKGLYLTQFQKDHTRKNFEDLMSRYNPPVEEHRYKIKFVPVVEVSRRSEHEIMQHANYDSSENVKREDRVRPHRLRTSDFCWCDQEATAYHNHHKVMPRYVVEITIKAWDPTDERNLNGVGQMKAHPIHEDETGKVHIRRHAMVQTCSMKDVADYSNHLVTEHYETKIARLKEEILSLKSASLTTKEDTSTKRQVSLFKAAHT